VSSHIELDIAERAKAVVPFESFIYLTDQLLADRVELPYSPALCLAKDIKRQYGARGFMRYCRLMRKFEPPWGKPDCHWLQSLRWQWEDIDPLEIKSWCDYLLVDALATVRAAGFVHQGAENIVNELAARSGAKRAAETAQADALEAIERAQIDAEVAAEFAIYEAWLAAGEPATDPLAEDHRKRKRCMLRYQIDAEYDAIFAWQNEQEAQNLIDDDVPSEDPRFAAYLKRSDEIEAQHRAMLAGWEARHGGLVAIRRLFLTDKRIPPGSSALAMDKMRVLFTLPPDIIEKLTAGEGMPINANTIPPQYHDAMRLLTSPLQFADGTSLPFSKFDPWSLPQRAPIDLTGMPMPSFPQLSIVPAEPLPDLIQSSGEFVRGFVPPDYLLDGVLQRRFVYSITAQTGVGKTAVAMLISAHVATGRKLGNLDVEKGTVLYFAGENPTDIQMRWLGSTRSMGIDPESTDVHFVPGATALSGIVPRITEEVARKRLSPALVIVDTAAAYFEGDDENSNTQAVDHARRLRSLTLLPGGPTVLILCHPTKRAAADDLIPRGGGAFLNEVDGNIALRKQDTLIGAEVQGKFRGREFSPLHFELNTVYHPLLKDARGRDIPTVVAKAIDDSTKQRMAESTKRNEDSLLKVIYEQPRASLRAMAAAMGWVDAKGQPQAMRVSRACEALAREKLVVKHRDAWECTPAGEKELNKLDREQPTSQPVTSVVTGRPPFPPFPTR
jgi:hypothetical protein